MFSEADYQEDLHQLEYVLEGLARNKKLGAVKDATTGETIGPAQGPLSGVLIDMLVNKIVPELITKYGPDLADVLTNAAKNWLTQKVGPPATT